MCHRVTCSVCKKATWAGCGNHIKAALNGVPIDQRCAGWEKGQCPDAPPGVTGNEQQCVCS